MHSAAVGHVTIDGALMPEPCLLDRRATNRRCEIEGISMLVVSEDQKFVRDEHQDDDEVRGSNV